MAAAASNKTVKLGIAIGALVVALGLLGWYYLGPKGGGPRVTQEEASQQQQQLEQVQEQERQLRQNNPNGATEAGA